MAAAAKLRILLVHPGVRECGEYREFPPWGILVVADALRRAGYETHVVDLDGEPELEERVAALVLGITPDLLGVTGKWGHAARRALRLVRTVERVRPEVRRVLGGPLVPFLPENSELARAFHALLPGDGELNLPRWIKAGMPPGRATAPAVIADLSSQRLHLPELLDLSPYVLPAHRSDLAVRTLYVSAARGCDGGCTFCYLQRHRLGAGLITMPVSNLVRELVELQEHHSLGGIYFVDDALVDRSDWRRAFCEALPRSAPRLSWGVDLRTALATEEVLDELWKGGCRALYMGVETVDDDVRSRVLGKADLNPLDAVDRALARGFAVRVSVVLGWPEETATSVCRTVAEVETRPGLLFDPFLYNTLPGTALACLYAPAFGPEHVYSEYSPGAPNLSDASDSVLIDGWERLWRIKVAREPARWRG